MRSAVKRMALDLSGAVVLTEAATGPYAVTPVLAALSGADRVYATASRARGDDGRVAWAETHALAARLDVAARLELVTVPSRDVTTRADIITNSGHVRPIDDRLVGWMKPTAVVPLMYEAWEFRSGDVDVAACARRGIAVAGTNERHPAVDVFPYLGVMAVKLLTDAGMAVHGLRVLLLSDNAFAEFIQRGLVGLGAQVDLASALPLNGTQRPHDAIVVALRPRVEPVLTAADARMIAEAWPGAVVAQFWGDLDRSALDAAGVPVWPTTAPEPGHMGILPSALGPEPIVRLQAAGLKVGEILWRQRRAGRSVADSLAALVTSGYGTTLPPGP
jgi:hypothetical protein